jgi:hypothetical protein
MGIVFLSFLSELCALKEMNKIKQQQCRLLFNAKILLIITAIA